MKITILVFLATSLMQGLSAQSFDVTGQVKDVNTKEPLEFCNIIVLDMKDSVITGTTTNAKGFFSLPVPQGQWKFCISYLGYANDTTDPIMITEGKFIGVFKLTPDVNSLKEVAIKEKASDNLLDRDVQIVTDDMKSGTSSTKEVLDKVNGVDYDRYNNSIKVDNDANVIILVDGVEKDQEYVKNLSPDRLKKVEVIRDPGGRYALEGYSAVINIILKKDYQGTEIFLYDRSMNDLDAGKSEYVFVQNSFNATVNYVYNKVNVYAKYSNDINNFNLFSNTKKSYNNGLVIDKGPLSDDELNTSMDEMYNNYTLGADYYINPKNTVSLETNVSHQPWKQNVGTVKNNVTVSNNDIVLEQYLYENINQSENTYTYASLFYEGKINENNVFNSNFTYMTNEDKYTSAITQDLFSLIDNGRNKRFNTKFYTEYTHTFKNKSGLQTGYGNTYLETYSYYTSGSVSNTSRYSDFRNKLYAYYSLLLSPKTSLKIGLAAESSNPDADGRKKSYFILQPYADFKYKMSSLLDFKLKYRASTNYPSMGQTNPFTYIVDEMSVKTGNPLLKPELTHRLSLQTNILQGLVTIEPYYHFSNNYIVEAGTLRADSVFERTYSNAGFYNPYGVEVRFTVPFGKTLFLQSGFEWYHASIEYDGNVNEFNDWCGNAQLIYVREKTGTVAGFQYQSNNRKFISAQGYEKGDNDFWIVFVQQPFLKQRLTVMLLYFTPITWGVDFYQGGRIQTDNYIEENSYNIDILKNIVMLELSYRFNKGKTVVSKEKQIEKEQQEKKGLF